MKKLLLLSSLSIFSLVQPLDHENAKKTYVVYSHGFGEGEDFNNKDRFTFLGHESFMPIYPDAPGQLNKAVFYTKPAVHTLVNDLHKIAQKEDCESIRLVGRSCGAGTAINGLAKLANYDENVEYFEGSNIRSQEDAQKIMQKINDGAFITTAPFLHVRKANQIAKGSELLSLLTVMGATAVISSPSCNNKDVSPGAAQVLFIAGSAVACYVFGDYLKKIYSQGIVTYALPYITGGNFDPHHEAPLQSVEKLRGKLTCPVLLHFNEQDRVLENPDEDTIKVYDALKGYNTHIIITDDAWHNAPSQQFATELQSFNKKYLKGDHVNMNAMQPTVEELRKKIYARKNILEKIMSQ